jgi:DNA gyrase subunit A
MAIRFAESDAPSRGRAAGGVRGVTLDGPSDRVVAVDLVSDDAEVLVVSENGYGKRTALTEYRIQTRGGKGIKTMDLTDKTGVLVAACVLQKDSVDDLRLVIVTENGIGIRIKVGEVRSTSSRSTQGVKLIELNGADRVKTVECLDVSKKEVDLEVE